jgi:hypothetical protein
MNGILDCLIQETCNVVVIDPSFTEMRGNSFQLIVAYVYCELDSHVPSPVEV